VPGSADLLLAADAVVAASSEGVVLCDPQRTHAVLNTKSSPVASFVKYRDVNFRGDDIESEVAKISKGRDHFLPFADLAEQWLGDSIATNIMMLGYAWQCGLLPLSFASIDAAIALNGVAVDANRAAFRDGRRLALDPALASQAGADSPGESATASLTSLQSVIDSRVEHLTHYQSRLYARRFRKRVNSFTKHCQQLGMDDHLPRIVATNYAKLLAYKDEYEVARLYSLPAFRNQLESTFEGDYSIYLHLAPPGLTRTGSDGRPVKKRYGQWILRVFQYLKHGKRLRGTKLDVFAYTEERRSERQWIKWYEYDIKLVIQHLNSDNIDAARRLLSLPDSIRGFGPVKQAAMTEASTQRKEAREQLLQAASVPQHNIHKEAA
jgi:indolepyruvate ferredoxin oxidoreductase